MNIYDSSWIINASRDEVWAVLNPRDFQNSPTTVTNPRVMQFESTRVEVIAEGDKDGRGLVRRCWFRAPWYLGGAARSWELVTEVRAPEYQHYEVMLCTPPHAQVSGSFTLEDLGDGTTRVHIHEEYTMESRWLAPLLERRVHNFFLADNDETFKGMIEEGVKHRRARLKKESPQ